MASMVSVQYYHYVFKYQDNMITIPRNSTYGKIKTQVWQIIYCEDFDFSYQFSIFI